jgi:type IX secretion system PorP/SprF family membrane protein
MPFSVSKSCCVVLALIMAGMLQVGHAQNYSLQNSWLVNPFIVNPASAASDYTMAHSTYRAQWLGFNGAPKFTSLGFNTLLNKTRAGAGFRFSNFTRGFLTTNDISATFAYGVPINKTNKVFFGLSGGMLTQSVNWGKVTDDTDPVLTTMNKAAIPSVSFGVMLKSASGFNIGVSLPQLIRSEQLNATFQIVPDNLVLMAYYSTWAPKGGVKSHNRSRTAAKRKKDGNPLEVYSLYRFTQNGGQAEVFAKLNTKAAWLLMGYRQGLGIIPGVGFNLGKLNLQYTYEAGIGGDIPLKSHEFMLLAKLGEKKVFKGDPGSKTKPTTNPPARGPRLPSNDPSISSVPKNRGKSNKPSTATATASNKPATATAKPATTKPVTTTTTTPTTTTDNNNTGSSGNTPRNRPNDNGLSTVTTPANTETTPPDTKPVVDEKPVETKPVVTEEKKPTENKPTQTKPVITEKPAETKPIETRPTVTQTKPTETKPVVTEEKKPTETKPTETKPVVTEEKKPVETKPVVTETKPVETKPTETKPVVTEETKPVETKPVVTETKPVVEEKPVETKPATEERKPEETKPTEKKSASPGEVVHLSEEEQAQHEEDLISRLDDHTDNPLEEHAGEEHEHSERHEFWTRGDHAKELEIGHYVIVGVFKSEANAKRVSDGYRNLGFKEVDYGFQSGKGFWFVHIAGSEDMDVPDANKLRNKYRKMKMFKDAWLLTVHQ